MENLSEHRDRPNKMVGDPPQHQMGIPPERNLSQGFGSYSANQNEIDAMGVRCTIRVRLPNGPG
jgi:hypothetical protein